MDSEVRSNVSLGRRSPLASTRIVVAERNVITRVGLRSILERNSGFAVVAEATTYEAALDAVDEHGPDLLIIDLDLGDDTTRGLKLCEEITDRYSETKILVLANKLSEIVVVEAVRRGVSGYLCKDDIRADELAKGVKTIQAGETVLGKGVGSLLARGLGSTRENAEHLTDRELEVIRAVSKGRSNKQIAQELFVSESTVKFHLRNASRKLKAHRRAEIVHLANSAGLL
jgi:two-component system, NarL family, response regulator DevR